MDELSLRSLPAFVGELIFPVEPRIKSGAGTVEKAGFRLRGSWVKKTFNKPITKDAETVPDSIF
jgi:hypothetical protein